MKIIITFLILIFAFQISFSQLSMTNQYNPVPGDIDSYAICDTSNISQGSAGVNQVWSFLTLTKIDTSDVSFVTSASTPYAGQFGTSNIASTNDNFSYTYFTTSASNILFNGSGSPGLVVSYTNPQLYMQYPFTYNSTFSDTYGCNYISNGTQTIRTGTTSVSGDAWGTINLPVGAFTNALRVKYIISTKDSSNPGAPIVTVTTNTSYVWFVPGRKFPVFEIVYSTLTFNGVLFASSKSINYNPRSSIIGIHQISTEVPQDFSLSQNYPNPFNPSTKIKFSIPLSRGMSEGRGVFTSIIVYDNLGREVSTLVNQQLAPGTYEADFDGTRLSSGTYYYRL
ncbi:MAG: hypothetical protein ABI543_12765, partial [Ignavibacteria bacterium]